VLNMAFVCIQTTCKDCPLMSQMLAMLLGEIEICITRGKNENFLNEYNNLKWSYSKQCVVKSLQQW
jgi:hypothetical protein